MVFVKVSVNDVGLAVMIGKRGEIEATIALGEYM